MTKINALSKASEVRSETAVRTGIGNWNSDEERWWTEFLVRHLFPSLVLEADLQG